MKYIDINNNMLAYDVVGTGPSLILLHGNMESSEIYKRHVSILSSRYTVYTLDTRNHGGSMSAPMSYKLFAYDLISFIETKRIFNPLVFGFSDGGITALFAASIFPEALKGVIACGANINPRGVKLRYRIIFRLMKIIQPRKRSYFELMIKEPRFRKKDLAKINKPVFLYQGSRDIVSKRHAKTMKALIANAALVILDKENHSSYVLDENKVVAIIDECFRQLL